MEHLDEISVKDLQRALDEVEGKKPTQRLLAAIAYKNGITQTELAAWYDVERRTIYSWLSRLDSESLEESVTDSQRSGRPRKLSKTQHEEFEYTLHEPPTEAGYNAPTWTPALVRTLLAETYDVDYSLPSCRRLMKEAGLSYQRYRRMAADAGHDDCDTGCNELTESDRRWVPR